MAEIHRPAGKQLKEFWVVDDFLPLRIGEEGRKRLQHFAVLVHPHGAPFACLRRDFDGRDPRAESFCFALPGLEIHPDRHRLFRGDLCQILAKFNDAGKLSVIRLRG